MLENCAILDEQKFYDCQINFKPGKSAKAAKISTYKTFYPKTIEVMKKLRQQTELPPVSKTQEKFKQEVPAAITPEQPISNQMSEMTQPTSNVSEPKNNNVINFPSSEVYQGKLESLSVSCYKDVGEVKGKIIPFAAKRLRVAKVVTDMTRDVTEKVAVASPVTNVEKVEEPVKTTFDFGQLPNIGNNTSPILEKEIQQAKPSLSVDDYLKKETTSNQVDATTLELQQAKKDYETVAESLETQYEIQAELEKELEDLKKQRVVKIEEYRQKTLAKTQNLHDVLAQINQLKDAINEEREALGLIEESNKKIA